LGSKTRCGMLMDALRKTMQNVFIRCVPIACGENLALTQLCKAGFDALLPLMNSAASLQ